jgi:hypothetical protein
VEGRHRAQGLALCRPHLQHRLSDLDAANVKTLINFMEQAVETIPNRLGKPVFYMNRTIRRFLRREARESVGSGGGLTFDNYAGKRILTFAASSTTVKVEIIMATDAALTAGIVVLAERTFLSRMCRSAR